MRVLRLVAIAGLALALIVACAVTSSHAEKRFALVVGNDRYANLGPNEQLQKAANDARTIGGALKGIGFDVIEGVNLPRSALLGKLDELVQRLQPGDTAFFFFAGHGVALDGVNYILPADVPNIAAGQETRLKGEAVGEPYVVGELTGRGVRVAVVVLDACRNNPFSRAGRSIGAARGLAPPPQVSGVFSIYAASSGQEAMDRLYDGDPSPNSVFTRVLAPMLGKPGLDLTDLARDVRDEVVQIAASAGYAQKPAYYDETSGRIYLASLQAAETAGVPVRPAEPAAPVAPPGPLPAPPPPTTPASARVMVIAAPPADYFVQDSIGRQSDTRLSLVQQTAKSNQITDDEEWWTNNRLDRPFWDPRSTVDPLPSTIPQTFQGQMIERAIRGAPVLAIYGREGQYLVAIDQTTGAIRFAMDFSAFQMPHDYLPEERGYIRMELNWAALDGNTLFVSHSHGTYAKSSKGYNAYLSAIDVKTGQLLWHSKPLVSNSQNFLVRGDAILSGYGFTAEKHFLYILNKADGRIVRQTPIRKTIDWLIEHDGKLFVRTYDSDFVFSYAGG